MTLAGALAIPGQRESGPKRATGKGQNGVDDHQQKTKKENMGKGHGSK